MVTAPVFFNEMQGMSIGVSAHRLMNRLNQRAVRQLRQAAFYSATGHGAFHAPSAFQVCQTVSRPSLHSCFAASTSTFRRSVCSRSIPDSKKNLGNFAAAETCFNSLRKEFESETSSFRDQRSVLFIPQAEYRGRFHTSTKCFVPRQLKPGC